MAARYDETGVGQAQDPVTDGFVRTTDYLT